VKAKGWGKVAGVWREGEAKRRGRWW